MTEIARLKVRLSGFVGGPGVATHYGLVPANFRPSVVALWDVLTNFMPAPVQAFVEAQGDLFEDSTGENTGVWTEGTEQLWNGALAGSYSAPSGAVLNWLTAQRIGGRLVRGKTFLVPLGGGNYQDNGTLDNTVLADLRAACATFVAAAPGEKQVWHRPTTPAGTDGASYPIVGSTVPDKACILRSRRD